MINDMTPPHSDEAEQAVLGSLMLDNAAFESVGPVLQADDFYHPQHRSIYSDVCRLIVACKVADVLTVHEAGGHDLQYLNGLVGSVAWARNAGSYAAIVRERAQRRELMRIGSELADAAWRGTEASDAVPQLVERAAAALAAMLAAGGRWSPKRIDTLLPGWLDRLQARADGQTDAIATGLTDLDRLMGGGMRPGELFVLGARPSMGKSALTLTMARNMARARYVLLLSQEDSEDMLVGRQVAAAGRVNLADIRAPQRAPDSMWTGVTEGVEAIAPLMLLVDDQPALAAADVRRKVLQARRATDGRLAVLMVDYLQLMVADGENRNRALGEIVADLKRMGKEFGLAVVLLSQLSREADKMEGPPRIDHLRDSGEIEGHADNIGLLWREARRKPTDENKHWAQLELAKHKNGPTDKINLWFDGATQRFEDWSGPPPYSATGRRG